MCADCVLIVCADCVLIVCADCVLIVCADCVCACVFESLCILGVSNITNHFYGFLEKMSSSASLHLLVCMGYLKHVSGG